MRKQNVVPWILIVIGLCACAQAPEEDTPRRVELQEGEAVYVVCVPSATPSAPAPTATETDAPTPTETPTGTPTSSPTVAPTPMSGTVDIVIDNVDPGFSVTWEQDEWGTWGKEDGHEQLWGVDHRSNYELGTGQDAATWEFYVPPGQYEVLGWWFASSWRPSDVPFTVYHADGQTTTRVDQTTNGGQWYSLGVYTFDGTGRVTVSDDCQTGERGVIADAIRVRSAGLSSSPTDTPKPSQTPEPTHTPRPTVAATVAATSVPSVLAAFPGAEGGGAQSLGGRGGQVILVTNLNDSGTGSLRACVDASGPRTCVFRVGGTIRISSQLYIRNPYITIAGQTAPGGGILIRSTENPYNAIRVETHDVVLRYLRVRHGKGTGAHQNVFVRNGSYNVVVDHCSLSWASDENMTVYGVSDPIRNVTISWNLIAEGLAGHSMAIIVGSDQNANQVTDIDIHHNLMAHNENRNPLHKGKSGRIVNNISYNWTWMSASVGGGIETDIIGNLFKEGPMPDTMPEILWRGPATCGAPCGSDGDPSIYTYGNQGASGQDPYGDNWADLLYDCDGFGDCHDYPPSRDYQRLAPMPAQYAPITVHPVEQLNDILLPSVGASARLDEHGNWVPCRDAVDERIVQEYLDGTGFTPSDESQVGGYPTIANGTPYPDADADGMSDVWETVHGFDPGNAADRNGDADGDGYTNLEEFLSGTTP